MRKTPEDRMDKTLARFEAEPLTPGEAIDAQNYISGILLASGYPDAAATAMATAGLVDVLAGSKAAPTPGNAFSKAFNDLFGGLRGGDRVTGEKANTPEGKAFSATAATLASSLRTLWASASTVAPGAKLILSFSNLDFVIGVVDPGDIERAFKELPGDHIVIVFNADGTISESRGPAVDGEEPASTVKDKVSKGLGARWTLIDRENPKSLPPWGARKRFTLKSGHTKELLASSTAFEEGIVERTTVTGWKVGGDGPLSTFSLDPKNNKWSREIVLVDVLGAWSDLTPAELADIEARLTL